MLLNKNDEIELSIDGYTAEGAGVGHYRGLAVFVAGSAAGDVITAHVIKAKKNYAVAIIKEIKKPSDSRTESDCNISSKCGGCCYRHINYDSELKIKKQRIEDAFKRIGHIDVSLAEITGSENISGYRNKAQLPAEFDGKSLHIGFYAFNTHRIVECDSCALQPEIFSKTVALIKSWAEKYPSAGKHIRHIYLRRGERTGELSVCPVINCEELPHIEELTESLKTLEGFKTLVINVNKADTNVILGEECRTLYGDGYINEEICDLKLKISPLSFFQVNTNTAEKLYECASDFATLSKDDTVLDLYCGIGSVGLSMAKRAKALIGIEIVPEAVEDAKENAKINGIDNARFICSDAAEAAKQLKDEGIRPTVITVDPPRKGLSAELIKTIAEMNPQKAVYISCDPATLARDCKTFADYGFEVKSIRAFDMFPRTAHVETVVLLEKG